MPNFTTLRDRDAWNTFRGYVYQVHLTIERWLDLQPEQSLELERGEDIDIVDITSHPSTGTSEERQRVLEQVKHREESITLRKPEAITAIACFLEHQKNNIGAILRFRYTTNVKEGQERPSPMPNGISAIAAWKQIWQGSLPGTVRNAALEGIRTILENAKQPDKLHDQTWLIFCDFRKNASDDQLLDLIRHFEWNTEAPKASSLSLKLQERLIERQQAIDHIQAEQQYQKLFVYLFKILCEPGIKKLTVKKLIEQLSDTLSESDHQLLKDVVNWVHALEEGMEALEQKLSQNNEEILLIKEKLLCLDREQAEPYIGQEVADCVEQLLQDYTKLFVGRETTVKQLDEFLTQKRTRILTLIAPAGFGKTALLANWVASRKGDGCFVLYHFFSQRYDITRSFSAAYRNLLRQLYDYHEPSDRQIPNNEDELRDKLYRLIKEYSERDGRPLVIVLDALDEADPPFKQFLPLLPENVFLIASARAEEGQEPEYLRGWTDNSQSLHLDRLCREAIAQWLRKTPELAAFAEDSYFVAQLDEITQGFPLYLRYLTDELSHAAKQGQNVYKVLTQTPKGFERYVEQQLKHLDKLDLPDERWQFFALLAVAKGGLEKEDVKALTGMRDRQLRQLNQSWQVTRWMRITEGKLYAFAHPLLATTFATRLGDDADDALQVLIKYCAKWQEYQSPYALRHYAEHLRDVEEWEKLYAIAHNEDFAITQRKHLPNEPDLPLKMVQIALLSAADRDNAGAMAEFLLLHAQRVGQITAQESPLEALRSGSLERALTLANLYEPERCVLWYLLLVWELKDMGRLEEAQATLEQLHNKKLPRLSEWWEGDYGACILVYIFDINEEAFTNLHNLLLEDRDRFSLCHHLVTKAHFSHALKVTQMINSDLERARALEKVAVAQAQAGKLAEAYETAQKITYKLRWNKLEWERALKAIAIAYAQAGEFTTALEKIISLEYEREEALAEIGKVQAQARDFQAALEAVRNTQDKLAFVLVEIAKVQVQDGKKDAALESLALAEEAAQPIKSEWQRILVLGEIAKAKAQVGEHELALATFFTQTWEITQSADSQKQLVSVLAEVGQALIQAGKSELVSATFTKMWDRVKTIEPEEKQISVLGEIARVQVQLEEAEMALNTLTIALEIAVKIKDTSQRDEALRTIAIVLAQAGNIEQALEIAQKINGEVFKAWALLGIADGQTKVGKYEVARTVIAINLKTNNRISKEKQQDLKLAIIVPMLAEIGKFKEARKQVYKIENKAQKVLTMTLIANLQVQTGQRDAALATLTNALEIARAMKDKEPIVWALKLVAVAFTKSEEIKAAIEITKEIFDKTTQAEALKSIAIIQVQAGDFDKALETLDKIDRERTTGEAFLLAKTTVMARAKKFDAALDTAKEMTNKSTWSDAMCQIAVSRAEAKEFDAALETVQKINKENQQAIVLGYIAAEQAKAGDIKAAQSTFDKAFGKARQVGQELERAIALEAIAEAQVAAGFALHAVKTADTILINRSEHLPAIAHAFVETGEQENFKKLLIPCAYYLNAAYQMCRHLARLYPEKAEEIAKVVSELN